MLTNAALKAAEPRARPYKIFDGQGLHLYVAPTGLRSWRMRFRFAGAEKLLVFGTFPEVGLAAARAMRDDARQQLRRHEDPSGARGRAAAARQERDEAATFEEVARAWHGQHARRWSPVHAADVLAALSRHVFPALGAAPIGAITSPMVLRMLRAIEARGRLETARRVRQNVSAVFAHAIAEGIVGSDPATVVARALLPSEGQRRQPAILDLDGARAALASIDRTGGAVRTKLASRLIALTAVRAGVARGATWSEFEGIEWEGEGKAPEALWRIPAARMKLTKAKKRDAANDHLVPLSRQAVEVLRAARRLGATAFVFPGAAGGGLPISESAIGNLYARAGLHGRHVPHGWRATFSTIMNERRPADRAAIDRALAHVGKDKVEAAYNRSAQLAARRAIFQEWADLLLDDYADASSLTGGRCAV